MIDPTSFSVVHLGAYPATRPLGQDGRNRLDDLLADRRGVDLLIDFAGVVVMNLSFADEFLAKFLISHDFATQGTTVKVVGLTPENRYTVEVCVERRETQVVAMQEDGTLVLLGEPILADTFERALRLGSFKANDLAANMALTAQNANNRLKRLTGCGALRRTQATGSARGGKEFVYEVLSVAAPDPERLSLA